MTGYNVLGSTSVDCRTASAAMAMVTARTEANYHMVGFSNSLVPIDINSKMSLPEVCSRISKVCSRYVVLLNYAHTCTPYTAKILASLILRISHI